MMVTHYNVALFLVVILIVLGLMVFVVMQFQNVVRHVTMAIYLKMICVIMVVP